MIHYTHQYTRFSKIDDIEMVLETIREHQAARKGDKERVIFNDTPVKVSSLRLRTFAHKGITCVRCSLEASFFAIEAPKPNKENVPPHLNLYGVRGDKEVLFTHDHVYPRSMGGADALENTQTMCHPCNQEKSILETEMHQQGWKYCHLAPPEKRIRVFVASSLIKSIAYLDHDGWHHDVVGGSGADGALWNESDPPLIWKQLPNTPPGYGGRLNTKMAAMSLGDRDE